MKRCFDVVSAALGLIVLAPVLALCVLAVKLDSPGPVIFRHRRVGRNGRAIEVWKFRSMVTDHDGPEITTGGESRITRSGRFLRRHKLDELPQLVNIVRGDMSVVGPRPEVARYVDRHPDAYRTILSVRPGLTDPASIAFRDEERLLAAADDPEWTYVETILPAKIDLSLSYVAERSFLGDLNLIIRTAAAVAGRDRPRESPVPGPLRQA